MENQNYYELFGVSSLLFRELKLERALEYLKPTGFKWLDLTIVPIYCPHYDLEATRNIDDEKIAEIVKRFDFEISSLNIFPGNYNKHDYKIVDKLIIRAAQLANKLNTRIITIPSGSPVESDRWLSSAKDISKNLNRIAKILYEEYGINLSIETPHQRTFTETLDESVRFHDVLNSQFVKCTLDTSHIAAQELSDVSKSIEKIGIHRINHIHLRDARGKNISFTPGKGDIDYLKYFQKLKESGYPGKMIFELEYHGYSAKKKLQELRFASNYSRELYEKNKISFKNKIKTMPLFLFAEKFIYNPVSSIKQYEHFFQFLKKYKKIVMRVLPEPVFEGKWVKKYRFNKNKMVIHEAGFVKIASQPSKVIKIGIIGLGYAGAKMHAHGYERLSNCRIIGGFDIDEKKRVSFAKRFKCDSFSTLEEMIEKAKPDIVSICTREWLHHDAAIYCLKNGVDVFCEKLMATKINDAISMVKTAKDCNRILAVNYNYRFIPAIQKIKEVIEFQALGKMAYFVINVHAFSYAHALDLLTYLGGEIKSISASTKNDPEKRIFAGTDWSQYDSDIQYIPSTSTNVIVEYVNGPTGILNSSIYYPLYSYIMSIEAVFEKGILNFSGLNMYNVKGKLTWYSKGPIKAVNMNYKKGMYADGYEQSFYGSIESFIKNYTENKIAETSGEQGLFNMMIEKYIHDSSSNESKIILHP